MSNIANKISMKLKTYQLAKINQHTVHIVESSNRLKQDARYYNILSSSRIHRNVREDLLYISKFTVPLVLLLQMFLDEIIDMFVPKKKLKFAENIPWFMITSFRSRSNNFFDCNINGVPLLKITDVIKHLVKAFKLVEFLYRSCVGFNDKNTFISIYCSLKVLNKFLRFLAFKCYIPRTPHTSYHPLLSYLNFESLEKRRIRLYLYFIFTLLNSYVDYPSFLN
ncbi:hypothetical protein AGLY_016049 [Aphis glycines]|uniref:Reverse transcriptase domain-containing protein n=1 Tax=Aphis glycines TaxID=307491 RepID=A0A6G0T0R7_APHGL|nr:hypothetical protein AGLY_016049 [Aphis glycines]